MSDNFKIAAKRHYNDAEYLKQAGRKANAGQLFGLAAECGIKAVMIQVLNKPNPRKHLHNGLLEHRFLDLLYSDLGQGRTSNYLAIIPNIQSFSNWSIDHRYWDDAAVPDSLEDWRSASTEVMKMLDVAILDRTL
jgi:hypothetical protein